VHREIKENPEKTKVRSAELSTSVLAAARVFRECGISFGTTRIAEVEFAEEAVMDYGDASGD